MNLNYNSFFVRKFLQCHAYNCPNTVCDLAWRVLVFSVIWTSAATLATFFLYVYMLGFWQVLTAIFTDSTLFQLMELNTETNTSIMIFFIFNISFLVGLVMVAVMNYIQHRKIKSLERIRRIERGELEASTPLPIMEFIKGIWSRIHDKTCRVIEYKNHPEEILQAERVKYYESLKAGQVANNKAE